ncbi:hypothetical protein BH10BAC5_BH10BAC5_04450 [soil metagenome]
MKINFTSRHFKLHEKIENEIKDRLNSLEKLQEEIMHIDVILSFEKSTNSIKYCELLVKLRDRTLTSNESADDFLKAADQAVEKIETQIAKIKDKQKEIDHTSINEITNQI